MRFYRAIMQKITCYFLLPGIFLFAGIGKVWAGEAELIVPDLRSVNFLGIDGHSLLAWGMIICLFGFLFGIVQFWGIRIIPVHKSMLDVSELIYETCKTYLITQGRGALFEEYAAVTEGQLIVPFPYLRKVKSWLRYFEDNRIVPNLSDI